MLACFVALATLAVYYWLAPGEAREVAVAVTLLAAVFAVDAAIRLRRTR